MKDLIERLETATSPDWKLDHEIFAVNRGWSYPLHGAALADFESETREHGRTNYTGSIDAALTLVPKGYAWRLDGWQSVTARVFIPETRHHTSWHVHDPNGAPRALCVAGLKAALTAANRTGE